MTVFVRFTAEFPDREEIRILLLLDRASGKEINRAYLDERYCADPACDCRRVMLAVHDPDREPLATIVYDFVGGASRTPRGENPYLEPAVEQPDGAPGILALVRGAIDGDPAYRARLVRHYEEMKQRTRDPAHPLWPTILQDRATMTQLAQSLIHSFSPAVAGRSGSGERRAGTKIGRNDPCLCGSGRKHKKCCGAA